MERFGADEQGRDECAGQGSEEGLRQHRTLDRNARLRERRLFLLRGLERAAEAPPQADDPLAGWFDEKTAARLHSAGAATLADVQRWQN